MLRFRNLLLSMNRARWQSSKTSRAQLTNGSILGVGEIEANGDDALDAVNVNCDAIGS